jgi:hypothetical protein
MDALAYAPEAVPVIGEVRRQTTSSGRPNTTWLLNHIFEYVGSGTLNQQKI